MGWGRKMQLSGCADVNSQAFIASVTPRNLKKYSLVRCREGDCKKGSIAPVNIYFLTILCYVRRNCPRILYLKSVYT